MATGWLRMCFFKCGAAVVVGEGGGSVVFGEGVVVGMAIVFRWPLVGGSLLAERWAARLGLPR